MGLKRGLTLSLSLALIAMMMGIVAIAESADQQGNAYFHVENADEIDIRDTGVYRWCCSPTNTDVTSWLVDASGQSAILDCEGVVFARNGVEDSLEIAIDASKITGFGHNGADDLYVMPPANSMWVAGDNKGFYKVSMDRAGRYNIPTLLIIGQLDCERGNDGLIFAHIAT